MNNLRFQRGRNYSLSALFPILKSMGLVYAVYALDMAFSMVANLILPLVTSKDDFTNYRRLVLYAGYAGFLHFGLLNGFYLEVLGRRIEDISYSLVSNVKRVLVIGQLGLLPVNAAVLVLILPSGYSLWLVLAIVMSWVINNLNTFHNYLMQGTRRFASFSRVSIVAKLCGVVLISQVAIWHIATTRNLLLVFLAPLAVLLLCYEWQWRIWKARITRPSIDSDRIPLRVILLLWQRGIALYGANICISLLFTIDNLLISLVYGPSAFADYAFAYGLISIIYLAFDGLTTVVTPYLTNAGRSNEQFKAPIQSIYTVLIWLSPLTYWIADILARTYYPQFGSASTLLSYFAAALPFSMLIRSRVVSLANATGRESLLLKFSVLGLMVSASAVGLAHISGHSTQAIARYWALAIAVDAVVGMVLLNRQGPPIDRFRELQVLAHAAAASLLFLLSIHLHVGMRGVIPYLIIGAVVVTFQLIDGKQLVRSMVRQ